MRRKPLKTRETNQCVDFCSKSAARIPLWLKFPLDPQPSDQIAQIAAPGNGHPPASLLSLLFAAKYQLSFASSRSTLPRIIQPHRDKSISCDHGNFIVAGYAVRHISPLRASLLDNPVVATY